MSRKTSEEIEKLLMGLTSVRGVTAAALIDADGFVTHIRRDFEIDADALGASVQIIFGAAQRSANNLRQGESKLLIAENGEGILLLAPLVQEFLLAIVADRNVMLGSVRFEVRETIPTLNGILGPGARTSLRTLA